MMKQQVHRVTAGRMWCIKTEKSFPEKIYNELLYYQDVVVDDHESCRGVIKVHGG